MTPDRVEITDFHRELAAADLMLAAAKIEFQAATYRNDQKRLEAARDKVRATMDAWCDAQLASTTDSLRRLTR